MDCTVTAPRLVSSSVFDVSCVMLALVSVCLSVLARSYLIFVYACMYVCRSRPQGYGGGRRQGGRCITAIVLTELPRRALT